MKYICEYGCGQEAKHQFQNGKWCCSSNWQLCLSARERQSKKLKGIKKNYSQKFVPWNKGLKGVQVPWNKGLTGSQTAWNKGLKGVQVAWNKNIPTSQKTKDKISKSLIGQVAWNKNKCGMWSEEQLKINRIKNTPSIEQIKKKYSLFAKVEEMKYKPGKEKEKVIQVHCKNHKCKNSKDKGGWFTPTKSQINERIRSIYRDGAYFYCSDGCKIECPLFNSRGTDPFKIDIKLYTSEEYQTFRQQVLNRENYKCEYCGKKANTVHHIMPQKLEPIHVLDPDYGISCCQKCHYKYGHKDECGTGKLASKICA